MLVFKVEGEWLVDSQNNARMQATREFIWWQLERREWLRLVIGLKQIQGWCNSVWAFMRKKKSGIASEMKLSVCASKFVYINIYVYKALQFLAIQGITIYVIRPLNYKYGFVMRIYIYKYIIYSILIYLNQCEWIMFSLNKKSMKFMKRKSVNWRPCQSEWF